MNRDEFREALDLSASGAPPSTVEVERLLMRARRVDRIRKRTAAMAGAAAVILVAGIGGFVFEKLPARGSASDDVSGQTRRLSPLELAYRQCAELVSSAASDRGNAASGELTGRVGIIDTDGTTVVVADNVDAWTCNLAPDTAVSNPRPLSGWDHASGHIAVADHFSIAVNARENVLPNEPGSYAWGGGVAPPGATEIRYEFSSGEDRAAVIKDGFWVIQYQSAEDISLGSILVSVDGSPLFRKPFELKPGPDTICNQVSHGC